MNVRLTIDTDDTRLAFDLMGNPKQIGSGTVASIPGEATLTLKSMFGRRAFGAPETLDLVLGFAGGVASGVVANWLYGKLKGRNVRLRIEEHEVEIEEGEIKRIISRHREERMTVVRLSSNRRIEADRRQRRFATLAPSAHAER